MRRRPLENIKNLESCFSFLNWISLTGLHAIVSLPYYCVIFLLGMGMGTVRNPNAIDEIEFEIDSETDLDWNANGEREPDQDKQINYSSFFNQVKPVRSSLRDFFVNHEAAHSITL